MSGLAHKFSSARRLQTGRRLVACAGLAALVLHAAVLRWSWWTSVPARVALPQAVAVRLTSVDAAGRRPDSTRPSAREPEALAMPTPSSPRPVDQSPAKAVATKPQALAAEVPTTMPTTTPSLASHTPSALVAVAPTVNVPTPSMPTTSVTLPLASPAHAATGSAGNAAPTSEATATATTEPARGAGAEGAAVDMPSSSVRYLVQPVLTFPPGSEELGEQGAVTLRVLVDERGFPAKVERIKSSGYARLDRQAMVVMRKARFQPHVVQGQPHAAWATVTLNFVLN